MKKIFTLFVAAALSFAVGCSDEYDDAALSGRVDDLENRVSALEELCQQLNTNVSSLQTIVSALQNSDYVVSVTPVTEGGETVGYSIVFAQSGTITIYNGADGADGKDGAAGADGKDGATPEVGVRQDTDGVYYWTLNGEWLTDANGNKVPASGKDGADGKDGAAGADGKDGVTPQFKIENGYWYVSVDGENWEMVGAATSDGGGESLRQHQCR